MPSPIGVADLAAGLPHAVSNSRRRLKERLCGRGINKQLKLGGSLNREIAGLVTLEDSSENFYLGCLIWWSPVVQEPQAPR